LNASQKEHNTYQSGKALDRVAKEQRFCKIINKKCKSAERYDKAGNRSKPKWSSSKRCQSLDSQIEQAGERPVTMPGDSVAPIEGNLLLLIAYPAK
jgi:hypothetical protein